MRNTPAPLNPFIFARPLAPQEAITRGEQVERLLALAEGGHYVTLYAPRRFGKTSLLAQLADAAQREADMVGVLVNLSDALSHGDVAARLDQAYRTLRGPLARFVADHLASVGIHGPLASLVLQPRTAASDPIAMIHALLELPVKLFERSGRRVLVCLDEFQTLVDLPGLDGVFRSHLQHHGHAASYVFAGSEPSLLRALFSDRARPLYGQAELVAVQRLAMEPAREYLARQFATTGRSADEVLTPLILVSEGHPQRLMLLAHRLWDLTPAGASADLWTLTRAHEAIMRFLEPEMRATWATLTANERRVLTALACGLSPYERAAQDSTGLSTPSAAQRAVSMLLDKAVLERDDEHDTLRIVDPLLMRWVRRRGGARPTFYVVPAQGEFVVTDGPSVAFARSSHPTIDEAAREADRLLGAIGHGGDVVIYDSDDPNELPDWAIRAWNS